MGGHKLELNITEEAYLNKRFSFIFGSVTIYTDEILLTKESFKNKISNIISNDTNLEHNAVAEMTLSEEGPYSFYKCISIQVKLSENFKNESNIYNHILLITKTYGTDGIYLTTDDGKYIRTIGGENVLEYSGIICFGKDTLIKTDQGEIAIKYLDKKTNTINGLRILEITKQYAHSQKLNLYKINSHALGYNLPERDTIITGEHKILFNGKMQKIDIIYLLKLKNKITKLEYKGESLYNILLEKYVNVLANGLEAETIEIK